jgi:hypothetical protein
MASASARDPWSADHTAVGDNKTTAQATRKPLRTEKRRMLITPYIRTGDRKAEVTPACTIGASYQLTKSLNKVLRIQKLLLAKTKRISPQALRSSYARWAD